MKCLRCDDGTLCICDTCERNWKQFFDEKPEYGRRVAYFRFERQKFGVAMLKILKDFDGDESESWVTEYSTCHDPHPNDHWLYLPSLRITKII